MFSASDATLARELRPHEMYVQGMRSDDWSCDGPWEVLRTFRITPLSRLDDDLISVPADWLPAGNSRAMSNRVLDVSKFVPAGRDRRRYAYHEEQLRRIIFALLMHPRHTETGVRMLGINSWLRCARDVILMARWSLEFKYNPESLFQHLTLGDLAEIATKELSLKRASSLNRALAHYGKRGLLKDVPNIAIEASDLLSGERSHKGEVLINVGNNDDTEQTQPFSDEFVSTFISKCLYISRQLAPSILGAFAQLRDKSDWEVHSQPAVLKRRLAMMKGMTWDLADGTTIDRLPFAIGLRSDGSRSADVEHWPPRTWVELRNLVTFVQCANYAIVACSTGARFSDLAGAEINCIREDGDAKLVSPTFKLVNVVGGRLRTWPLAEDALAALRTQQRLARAVAGEEETHLWVTINEPRSEERGRALNDINENNTRFVRALGLEGLLNGIRPHTHRWRATMARLGAIALVDAPRVLMRLFGHRNIEMTLRYILANDDIRDELDEAYRAATYALSKKILNEVNEFEGPAAPRLISLIEQVTSAAADAPTEERQREMMEFLNVMGAPAKVVRPGILCLMQHGQFARCSRRHGKANPARCKVECEHRLEHVDGSSEADSVIAFIVRKLQDRDVQSQPLQLASLEGQLITQLSRYSAVRERWLEHSALVARLWKISGGSINER